MIDFRFIHLSSLSPRLVPIFRHAQYRVGDFYTSDVFLLTYYKMRSQNVFSYWVGTLTTVCMDIIYEQSTFVQFPDPWFSIIQYSFYKQFITQSVAAMRVSNKAASYDHDYYRKLAGKTIFITGGSRGIGKAIGLKVARDGANVVIAAKTAEPHPTLPGTIYTAAEESWSLLVRFR